MKKDKYRKAIFVVVYSEKNGVVEYLLLKRKLHWAGWEFPKGGIENFELKRKTVKREVFEETGLVPLKIKKHNFSGRYKYHKLLKDRPGFVGQTFTLYSVKVKKEKVSLDKKEHSTYKWRGYKDAIKSLKFANQKKALTIVNGWLMEKLKKS